MADFYKHEIAKWMVATEGLTLEQEAAYHRIVTTIRLYERPFHANLRVLAGMWRCNERKALRLMNELIAAEKITIEDGFIIDRKAVDDASNLRQLRVEAASAGRRGGIESGNSRRKALKDNESGQGYPSTREDKIREDSSSSSNPRARDPDFSDPGRPVTSLPDDAWALYRSVVKSVGLREDALPTHWMPPAAVIHVQRWLGMGLSEQEIIDTARFTRTNHKDPPAGPKALDGAMSRTAVAKQMPPMKSPEAPQPRMIGGPNAARPDQTSQQDRRAEIIRAAARGTT